MEKTLLTITENIRISENAWRMKLVSERKIPKSKPGQFINMKIAGTYLRRPFSIYSQNGDELTILYKIVGSGTEIMSGMNEGEAIDTLLPLGNGYDLKKCIGNIALVAGGMGMPPIYNLAKSLAENGQKPTVMLGFASDDQILPLSDFVPLDIDPIVTTEDGSAGLTGLVTDAMKENEYDYVCACGPEPMLKAVWDITPDGQFSFEERMGCGFGACMGCSLKTKDGSKRVCADGPVLMKEEILW